MHNRDRSNTARITEEAKPALRFGFVEIRIQRGVVVHLELPIGLMALAAGKQVIGELLGGARQVIVLRQGNRQLASDAFAMMRT